MYASGAPAAAIPQPRARLRAEERVTEETSRRRLFEAEVERLLDRLYGTALRLTRNRADAEDLVGETVAKAWASLAELRDPRTFEAWIQRILATTFVSQWRHRRARPEVALDANEDDAARDGEGFSLFERLHQPFLLWWSTPEAMLETKLLREHLERALDSLPDAFRIAIVLVEVQGCSYGEAAEVLAVPVGTVRSRISRARGLLQRALWDEAKEAGIVPGHGRRKEERD
jgi:RNA polymerase sigma-70 factor (ECF subfamily)